MKDKIKCLLKYARQIMEYSSETDEFKEVRNAACSIYM